MSMEKEESPLFEAPNKQRAREGTANWEYLACAIMIYRTC
jgi:hypothetical protein